jgi:hypothetical protein
VDPRGHILRNAVLTLGLIGCEKTKWEVPDENSLKGQGAEDFLEYGGSKEFINISRVLHNFQSQKHPPPDDSHLSEEIKGEDRLS